MSLTQVKARNLLADIADKFDLPIDELYKVAGDRVKKPNLFASPAAADFAKKVGVSCDGVKASGKTGKITIDDIRLAIGEEPKKKKENLFASPAAKKLAQENNLKQEDFGPKDKTGKRRKASKKRTITIKDVRKKLGLDKKKTKKKTKKTKKEESDSESSSDSSDSEEEN